MYISRPSAKNIIFFHVSVHMLFARLEALLIYIIKGESLNLRSSETLLEVGKVGGRKSWRSVSLSFMLEVPFRKFQQLQ